jgi:hypothetical protein
MYSAVRTGSTPPPPIRAHAAGFSGTSTFFPVAVHASRLAFVARNSPVLACNAMECAIALHRGNLDACQSMALPAPLVCNTRTSASVWPHF